MSAQTLCETNHITCCNSYRSWTIMPQALNPPQKWRVSAL